MVWEAINHRWRSGARRMSSLPTTPPTRGVVRGMAGSRYALIGGCSDVSSTDASGGAEFGVTAGRDGRIRDVSQRVRGALACVAGLAMLVSGCSGEPSQPIATAQGQACQPQIETGVGDAEVWVKSVGAYSPCYATFSLSSGNHLTVGAEGAHGLRLSLAELSEPGDAVSMLYGSGDIDYLTMSSDGEWTVDIEPLSTAPSWNGEALSGDGPAVYRLAEGANIPQSVRAEGTDVSIVAVSVNAPDEPTALESSDGSGVELPEGLLMIVVNGEGKWTITPAD